MKAKLFFYIFILLTIAFIWGQSCLPAEVSNDESNAFREIVERILGTDSAFANFVSIYIRKIAHFTEFAVLGLEMTLFTYLCTKSRISDLIRCAYFGPVIAAIDETIQIFSGRGSSIIDVMIDTVGYIFAFLLTSLFYSVIRKVVFIIRERNRSKNV